MLAEFLNQRLQIASGEHRIGDDQSHEDEEMKEAHPDRKQQLMEELIGLKEEIGQLKALQMDYSQNRID